MVAIMPLAFNSIAQTLSSDENGSGYKVTIGPKQKLILELLKQQLKDDKEFGKDADAIVEALDESRGDDEIGPECYTYTPLLIESLSENAKFESFFNIQGNFRYSFSSNNGEQDILKTYNFYKHYLDDSDVMGITPMVAIKENGFERVINNPDASIYVYNNYCEPLNAILDQNKNLPVPQLLGILKQRFSK